MVVEAVESLGGATTNVAVRDWILKRYPGTLPNTIQCQIIALSVNHPSRIHYSEAAKPRVADPTNNIDKLYRTGTGQIATWDPIKHGRWSVVRSDDDTLQVIPTDLDHEPDPSVKEPSADSAHSTGCFAAEAHLRDYLAVNLHLIEHGLELFSSESGTSGVEYKTGIGRIDILARDTQGDFVVIELKVSRGPDDVAGQILRYVNWVRKHLSEGKRVRGVIIAQHISDKIKYAIASDPLVSAREYQLLISIGPPIAA